MIRNYAFGNPEMMPWMHKNGKFDLDQWNDDFWERLQRNLRIPLIVTTLFNVKGSGRGWIR